MESFKSFAVKTLIVLSCVFLFFSCKPASYLSSVQLTEKLPTLTPEMDWLSIETAYPDGTAISSSNSASNTVYGSYSTLNGNVPGSASYGSTASASQYLKNPQIKAIRDILTSNTYNICEKFGESHGTIVWTIDSHNEYKSGNFFVLLSGLTLGTINLLGVPTNRHTGYAELKANIYNSKRNLIGTYTSSSVKKYWVAMWWGYSSTSATSMAYNNVLTESINDIISQISRDSKQLREKL